MKNFLEIKNLRVKSNGKEILKGIDLKIKKGEFLVLLGPNASGKSTLSQTIMGNPKYTINSGKIIFQSKDITRFPPEKKAKLGISLTWQTPPAVKGVLLSQLLEKISKTDKSVISEGKGLLDREVNVDFSGGERKIAELLQILAQKPKLVILDEIDSGLDLKRTSIVSKIIKKELLDKRISVIMITHSGHLLNLKPDKTAVILDGKIVCIDQSYKIILNTIKKYGYEKCKKCEHCHK